MTLADHSTNVQRLQWRLTNSGLRLPDQIVKRDGTVAPFDLNRIDRVLRRCYDSLEAEPETPIPTIVQGVAYAVAARHASSTPTVEQVSDMVEITLLAHGELEAVNHFVAYRDARARDRGVRVPDDVRRAFAEAEQYFPTQLQQFMFLDKYSRWDWTSMRRETWIETCDRGIDYLRWLVLDHGATLPDEIFERIHQAMLRMEVMPSMRSLSQAGESARRNSLAIYNCSYAPLVDARSFAELIILSFAGCGVGWSVEPEYVELWPRVKRQTGNRHKDVIKDSTEGWARSVEILIGALLDGRDVDFDYSQIRPAGAPLLTKGGRASGPDPLIEAHRFIRRTILARQGSHLTSLDLHDMACVTAGAAVAGGVRRTAAICLHAHDDELMLTCKTGAALDANLQRHNANNSVVWPDNLDQLDVARFMLTMAESNRGEPGIFSRSNALRTRPARRAAANFGTNPCGEINLRPWGLCNLSIAVARPGDTAEDLARKVELATIIGTIQSLATNFPGLRPEWKQNAEEERLLGVDITGQADNELLRDVTLTGKALRRQLKQIAIETNEEYAHLLGINPAAAITCDKPSGNSSQLLDCSSGIHRRWAPFYIRRTRVSAATPLFRVLRDSGMDLRPDNGQTTENAHTWVASWPMRAPEGATTRKDLTAVEQCEFWLLNKTAWTEHNPSVTITYQPHELIQLIDWVWQHKDLIGGMAFLPADDYGYEQAPYEETDEATYHRMVAEMPKIDWALLHHYEHSDMTTAAQELACMSGACEV